MTDIRSRHVPDTAFIGQCVWCHGPWPCDAIREADRADKAEAALAEARRYGDTWYAACEQAVDERDKAESALAEHRTRCHDYDPDRTIAFLQERADKAGAVADEVYAETARADAAETALAGMEANYHGAAQGRAIEKARADKAEAALVECQEWRDKWKLAVDEIVPALAKARFDAEALAEALENLGPIDKYGSGWAEARAALAAHKEVK